jgi:type IV pilus assembly protein PilB
LITASVNLVLAQRLARRICVDCKQEAETDKQSLIDLGVGEDLLDGARVYKGAGCATCNNTGYKGRVALYEVMRFSDDLKERVLQGASTAELKVEAIREGMVTLRVAGIAKMLEGMTTAEEVLRVTMSD